MVEEFKKAVERHRDRVYTQSYYTLGTREEAEDVTQEVLIRLWENWQDLESDRITGWLIHVTKNACIDAMRRRRTYERRVIAAGDSDVITRAASTAPGPEYLTAASELRGQLEKAIRDIEEPYRSLIILREIEDMKYGEISKAMNMPLNTVKTYLHRGRRMLREQLKESWRNEARS